MRQNDIECGGIMLVNTEKNRTFSVLQAVMALFITIVPALLGFLDRTAGAYMLFLVTGVLFIMRIKSTRNIYVSICNFIFLILLFYSTVSLIWVNNRNGHVEYMTMITGLMLFFCLTADYFSESNDEKIHRRMMYMVAISCAICAAVNILYWIICLVPYGKADNFSQGLGSSDFLAAFMIVGILITLKLMVNNKKRRIALFSVFLVMMAFVFYMAKSSIAVIFVAMMAGIYYLTRKSKRFFVPLTLSLATVFLIAVIAIVNANGQFAVFKDVFEYGIRHIFGNGGGFWSGGEMFLKSGYENAALPGLFAVLCGASGLVGIICALGITARAVVQFVKIKSWACAVNLFLTVMIMILPLAENSVCLFLWVGLTAYNEKESEFMVKRTFEKKALSKLVTITVVATIISAVLLCQAFIKMSAYNNLKKGKYLEAYELYCAAATLNFTDGESCRMAAYAMNESDMIQTRSKEALDLLDKAGKRDKYNLQNYVIRAQVYFNCGMYEMSAKEYEIVASKAVVNDRYNLLMVKSLYKIVERQEKGSPETKALYDKMVEIAKNTENLDYREEINNIADKALVYTKGELNVESIS